MAQWPNSLLDSVESHARDRLSSFFRAYPIEGAAVKLLPFSAQLKPNAVARGASDRNGSIQMWRGLPIALFDACCTLASTPSFWPEIPIDKSRIRTNPVSGPSQPWWLIDYSGVAQDGRRSFPAVMTDDPGRYYIGDNLWWTAIEFIVYHELAHILLGHCEWLERECGAVELFEVQPMEALPGCGNSWRDGVKRAMELEADRFATVLQAQALFKPTTSDVRNTFRDEDEAWHTRFCHASMFTLALIFHKAGGRYRRGSHPSPHTRLINYINNYLDFKMALNRLSASERAAIARVCNEDEMEIANALDIAPRRLYHYATADTEQELAARAQALREYADARAARIQSASAKTIERLAKVFGSSDLVRMSRALGFEEQHGASDSEARRESE